MNTVILSCSLNPGSKSRILANLLKERVEGAQFVDLRDYDLPLCDGAAAYGHPDVGKLSQLLAEADGILIALPIYNYSINSALKNAIELTGKDVWSNKVVGFAAAAGGERSYMSVLSIANSLMLDFRCVVVPRFVYASARSFSETTLKDEGVLERIDALAKEFVRMGTALKQ